MGKITDSINAILEKSGIKLTKAVDIKLMIDTTTKEGKRIATTAEAWAVGVDVFVDDGSGNPMPAPAGEYTLEDGTKITVNEKGIVDAVTPGTPEDMTAEQVAAVVETLASRVKTAEDLAKDFDTKMAAITTERDTLKGENERLKLEIKAHEAQIKLLEKKPAAASVTEPKPIKASAVKPEKPRENMTYFERVLSSRLSNN